MLHQLCTAVPAAAQRLPSCSHPAAGLLNWRFVAAQGTNDELGVRGPGGAVHGRTARSNRDGRQWGGTERKDCSSLARRLWGHGPSLAVSRSSRHPSSSPCRRCHLPEARIWDIAMSSLATPSLSTFRESPRRVCRSHWPRPCLPQGSPEQDLQVMLGAFPQSTVSSGALESAKSIPPAQAQALLSLHRNQSQSQGPAAGSLPDKLPSDQTVAQTMNPRPSPIQCPQLSLEQASSMHTVQKQVCACRSQGLKSTTASGVHSLPSGLLGFHTTSLHWSSPWLDSTGSQLSQDWEGLGGFLGPSESLLFASFPRQFWPSTLSSELLCKAEPQGKGLPPRICLPEGIWQCLGTFIVVQIGWPDAATQHAAPTRRRWVRALRA